MANDYISQTVDLALLANPVISQTVIYSRNQTTSIDPVNPFPVTAIVDTGGPYSDPSGAFYAGVMLEISAIPLGPMKGDRIAINDGAVKSGSYLVQEIYPDAGAGCAWLKVRWTGA